MALLVTELLSSIGREKALRFRRVQLLGLQAQRMKCSYSPTCSAFSQLRFILD